MSTSNPESIFKIDSEPGAFYDAIWYEPIHSDRFADLVIDIRNMEVRKAIPVETEWGSHSCIDVHSDDGWRVQCRRTGSVPGNGLGYGSVYLRFVNPDGYKIVIVKTMATHVPENKCYYKIHAVFNHLFPVLKLVLSKQAPLISKFDRTDLYGYDLKNFFDAVRTPHIWFNTSKPSKKKFLVSLEFTNRILTWSMVGVGWEEARQWENYHSNPIERNYWLNQKVNAGYCFSSDEAVSWLKIVKPHQHQKAAQWRSAGFTPETMKTAQQYGYEISEQDITRWLKIEPAKIPYYIQAGISLEESVRLELSQEPPRIEQLWYMIAVTPPDKRKRL